MINIQKGQLADIWPKENLSPEIESISFAIKQEYDLIKSVIEKAYCYCSITKLTTDMLDAISADMSILNYNEGMTDAEKQQMILDDHIVKDTGVSLKSFLLTAESAIGTDITIKEWYKTDGDPGHFSAEMYNTVMNPEDIEKLLNSIKNISSVIDSIKIIYSENYSNLYSGITIKQFKEYSSVPGTVSDPVSGIDYLGDGNGALITDSEGTVFVYTEVE